MKWVRVDARQGTKCMISIESWHPGPAPIERLQQGLKTIHQYWLSIDALDSIEIGLSSVYMFPFVADRGSRMELYAAHWV